MKPPVGPVAQAPKTSAPATVQAVRESAWVPDVLAPLAFVSSLAVTLLAIRAVLVANAFGLFVVSLGFIVGGAFLIGACSGVVARKFSDAVHARGMVTTPWPPLSKPGRLGRFTEQFSQLILHVSFAILEGYVLSKQTWWSEPETMFEGTKEAQFAKPVPGDVTFLYVVQLAVWLVMLGNHLFLTELREDHGVMLLHHIVTIGLVSLSWLYGTTSIGVCVLWIHDMSDIFVDLLKMMNLVKLGGPKGYYLTEISYAGALVAWLYWRLFQFPKVLYAALVVPHVVFEGPSMPTTLAPSQLLEWLGRVNEEMPSYLASNALLFALLAMHVYWFHLLVLVGWRIMFVNTLEASAVYEGDEGVQGVEEGKKKGGAVPPRAEQLPVGAAAGEKHVAEGGVPKAPLTDEAKGRASPTAQPAVQKRMRRE